MRNILLVALTAVMGFMVACDDHDVLPPYDTPAKIFMVDSVFHYKDKISSQGDTLKFRVVGHVNDTTTKYPISVTLKAVDSVTNVQLSGNYMKTFRIKYDTSDYYKTKMIRWTNADTPAIYMTTPALPVGTKLRSTATFAYGLNLSSQLGNTSLTVKNNGLTQ
jgi:hypothetical protein